MTWKGQLSFTVAFLVLGVLMLVGGGSSRLWGFGYLAIAAGWGYLARQTYRKEPPNHGRGRTKGQPP